MNGESAVAVRFSDYESIDTVRGFVGYADWVWIDTVKNLPIDDINWPVLRKFKQCLVCPERWGRKGDIASYSEILRRMNYSVDAVMTNLECAQLWH